MLARRVRTRRFVSLLTVTLALIALGRPFLLCAGMAHSVAAPASHQAHAAHAAHHGGQAGQVPEPNYPKHGHGLDECCTVCASACGGCAGSGATSLVALNAPAVRTIRPLGALALPPAERPHAQPFPIGPPTPLVV